MIQFDEKEVKELTKSVFLDIKIYIDRAIKEEMKKILQEKKKRYQESNIDFL